VSEESEEERGQKEWKNSISLVRGGWVWVAKGVLTFIETCPKGQVMFEKNVENLFEVAA
jgi:hypothetical protein